MKKVYLLLAVIGAVVCAVIPRRLDDDGHVLVYDVKPIVD